VFRGLPDDREADSAGSISQLPQSPKEAIIESPVTPAGFPSQKIRAKGRVMAASIIHVGIDDCQRIEVLKVAGFDVNQCNSFDQLHSALLGIPAADAVAIAEGRSEVVEKAVSLTRATSSIPLILFQGVSPHSLSDSDFDLVVPLLTNPEVWIARVQRLIDESRALRSHSEAIRQSSASLKQESIQLSYDAKEIVERTRLELARSRKEIERNRQN
jgi:hypothetical protein